MCGCSWNVIVSWEYCDILSTSHHWHWLMVLIDMMEYCGPSAIYIALQDSFTHSSSDVVSFPTFLRKNDLCRPTGVHFNNLSALKLEEFSPVSVEISTFQHTLLTRQWFYVTLLQKKNLCLTVDHSLLITHVETVFGVSDAALNWIKSSLSDRKQFVTMGGCRSEVGVISIWCSSGVNFGPFSLLLIYIFPFGQLLRSLGFKFHFYTDDRFTRIQNLMIM